MKLSDIVSYIRNGQKYELDIIREELRARYDHLTRRASNGLRPGDKVEWDSRRGYTVRGTVIKVNPKTILCKDENMVPWKVTASLLRPQKAA